MTFEIGLVFAIISLAMLLFFTEKFSVDTVAIGVMVLFMVFGILDVKEGMAGFSNSATITVSAMFVISYGIFQTGILDRFSSFLGNQAQKSETKLILTLMVASGLLSAFINDTAVVALLMPAVIHLGKQNQIPPSKLLMPLSFGALMGGICTLLGTSTNILVSGIAEQAGLPSFGIFEMTGLGVIFLLAGTVYMVTIGNLLNPNRKPKPGISDTIDLGNYLMEITVGEEYEQVQQPIQKNSLFKNHSLKALQIIREDGTKTRVFPNTPILVGDTIRLITDQSNLERLKKTKGIKIKAELDWNIDSLTNDEEKIFEAVVTPNSSLINQSIKNVNFSQLYEQVTVLGIRHRAGLLETWISKVSLKSGDVLLLRATDESIQSINKSNDLLLVSSKKSKSLNKTQVFLTIGILAFVVGISALGILPIPLSATAGAVAMVMLGSLTPEEAYKAIDWKVIFMLAGVLSMGAALEKTGGSVFIGEAVVEAFGQYGPQAVLSALFGLTFLLTNVMSNNATAALLAPIAISIAISLEVDSRPFLMAVTFASSLSFMTPMGYQTNTMIYNPGNYQFSDYLKVGTPLNLLFWIMASILIPVFFPF